MCLRWWREIVSGSVTGLFVKFKTLQGGCLQVRFEKLIKKEDDK